MQRSEHRIKARGLADLLLPFALIDDGIMYSRMARSWRAGHTADRT